MTATVQPSHARVIGLSVGDLVEVRSVEKILATLDDRAELEALPFIPEMLAFFRWIGHDDWLRTAAGRRPRSCDPSSSQMTMLETGPVAKLGQGPDTCEEASQQCGH